MSVSSPSPTISGREKKILAMQNTCASQQTTASSTLDLQDDDELVKILIQIDLESEPQWKVYRDDMGMYTLHNQKETPHFTANHFVNVKLTATYVELVEAINKLAISKPRPGVRGIENSPNFHNVHLNEQEVVPIDPKGLEIPDQDLAPRGPDLATLAKQLKVSSEIKLTSIGILVETPGGEKGFIEIEAEEEGHCEMALKFIAARGLRDMLVANYVDTGKMLRF